MFPAAIVQTSVRQLKLTATPHARRRRPPPLTQVVALPPVDLVISGQIKASDIPPTNEKVDIWALGVTLYELVTGGQGGVWRGGHR